ncbi:MAG: MFS transporter [Candidatus Methanoplasma sp.]|jgi:sugar phosphate permease|nr:MFS transporter [Candidatus Methanoplasma sp.]
MADLSYVKRNLVRYRWIVFAVLTTAYFFVYFQRMAVGVVGIDIVEDVGGSIGVLSAVYFWTYTIMQIPSGLLADHLGPRKASAIFLSVAAAGSLITFCADSFLVAVIGKIMIAAGMAVVYIPLMKVISVWFGKKDFPQLAGIVIAVGNVGAIAASAPLEVLAEAFGWRDVFLVLGTVTALLAVSCMLFVRDHPHDKGFPGVEELGTDDDRSDATDVKLPMIQGLKMVAAGGRKFWPLALAYFFVYGSIMVFQGTWAKIYFDNIYDFVMSVVWFITAIGVGKIIGTVVIGVFSGRGVIRSKRRAMLFGTVCFSGIWAVIWLFSGDVDSYWFWMAVSFLFGFFGGFMTLSFTQVKECYPVAISGTAVSAMNVFLFLGASVCITMTEAVVGTSYTVESFGELWMIMFVMSVAAAILVFLSVENNRSTQGN